MTTVTITTALCVALGCAVCSSARAEPTRALYIDEDLFSGMATDADYTGGVAVVFANDLIAESDNTRRWLTRLNRLVGMQSSSYRYEFEVGAAAFTPADTASSAVVAGDRPYAGLVYGSAAVIQSQDDRHSAVTVLTVGALGLGIVPTAQRRIHRAMGSAQPNGWQHQISAGGEPTLRLAHEQTWARPAVDLAGGRAQWLWRAGAGLGFITDVSVGTAVRFGRFSDSRWSIHTSPTGLSDRALSGHADPHDRFLYATLSARLPLHSVFLQGQFRDSDVTVPSSERRYLIPDASLGYVAGLRNGRALHYFLRAQRSDVRLTKRSESIVYAGLSLSW